MMAGTTFRKRVDCSAVNLASNRPAMMYSMRPTACMTFVWETSSGFRAKAASGLGSMRSKRSLIAARSFIGSMRSPLLSMRTMRHLSPDLYDKRVKESGLASSGRGNDPMPAKSGFVEECERDTNLRECSEGSVCKVIGEGGFGVLFGVLFDLSANIFEKTASLIISIEKRTYKLGNTFWFVAYLKRCCEVRELRGSGESWSANAGKCSRIAIYAAVSKCMNSSKLFSSETLRCHT